MTSKTVTVDLNTAVELYAMYQNLSLADQHFKTCQSSDFRQFVSSSFRAKNTTNAFSALKHAIDIVKAETDTSNGGE